MDIGREIRKLGGNSYSLRLIFKDKSKIVHKTEKINGTLYETNIDENGRIYLPKEFSEGKYGLFSKSGFATLSLFGYIILYQKMNPNKILKAIRKSPDTKVALSLVDRTKRKFPKSPYLNNKFDIKLKPVLAPVSVSSDLNIKFEKFNFSDYKEKKNNIEELLKVKNFGISRVRLTIPRTFLEFAGIDAKYITKEEIVIFDLGNEVEIWEKSVWDSRVDKMKLLSNEAKVFLYSDKIRSRQRWSFFFPFLIKGGYTIKENMLVYENDFDDIILIS